MLDEAKRRRALAVFLEVRADNDAAQALYRRNGFVDLRVRRGYYDSGRADALEMQRVL
jgi:ribosomal-protein-alanine N-acetyltransferase